MKPRFLWPGISSDALLRGGALVSMRATATATLGGVFVHRSHRQRRCRRVAHVDQHVRARRIDQGHPYLGRLRADHEPERRHLSRTTTFDAQNQASSLGVSQERPGGHGHRTVHDRERDRRRGLEARAFAHHDPGNEPKFYVHRADVAGQRAHPERAPGKLAALCAAIHAGDGLGMAQFDLAVAGRKIDRSVLRHDVRQHHARRGQHETAATDRFALEIVVGDLRPCATAGGNERQIAARRICG